MQYRSRYLPPEEWRTCKVMAGPIDGAVWIKEPDHEIGCVVYCCHYEFRNKPAEPKPVQAILKNVSVAKTRDSVEDIPKERRHNSGIGAEVA